MRTILALLGADADSAAKAAATTKSLAADPASMRAATLFAATIVGGIFALGLLADIAWSAAQ